MVPNPQRLKGVEHVNRTDGCTVVISARIVDAVITAGLSRVHSLTRPSALGQSRRQMPGSARNPPKNHHMPRGLSAVSTTAAHCDGRLSRLQRADSRDAWRGIRVPTQWIRDGEGQPGRQQLRPDCGSRVNSPVIGADFLDGPKI